MTTRRCVEVCGADLNPQGMPLKRLLPRKIIWRREIFQGSICLVLDVRMPRLKGPGLQEALESRGACEKIVFLTGHGDVPTATRAMKEDAVDF